MPESLFGLPISIRNALTRMNCLIFEEINILIQSLVFNFRSQIHQQWFPNKKLIPLSPPKQPSPFGQNSANFTVIPGMIFRWSTLIHFSRFLLPIFSFYYLNLTFLIQRDSKTASEWLWPPRARQLVTNLRGIISLPFPFSEDFTLFGRFNLFCVS